MSVQLVLYPQNYNGRYSTSTISVFNEYVADNVNFNTVNSLAGYDSTASDVGLDAINNSVGIAAWKRFRSTGGTFSSVTMPSQSYANKLELYSASGTTSSSGVYQKIVGLTQNSVYDLTINITQAGAGGLLVIGTQGNITSQYETLGGQTLFTSISTASTGTQTLTFTADSPEEILLIAYQNDNGTTVYIDKISIQESAQQPTQIFTDLDDGQVICDLYEDEDIPLSLSIDNFKNAAEKVQSYSKDFNLPATKRNNKIFTHLFEVTKTQDAFSFNPYVKTECILKQDGYNIFKGYLRIIDIINQEGEISYNVNLYSEGIALADTLKEKTFNDLSTILSELDHRYNKSNIKASWDSTGITLLTALGANSFAGNQGDTTTQVLKYPFVDWTGSISLTSPTTSIPDGTPFLSKLEDAFRPFINCKYLFDNIMRDAGFTYESTFLNSNKFAKLYMDFNFTGEVPSDTKLGRYGFESGITSLQSTTSYQNIPLTYNEFSTDMGWNNTTNKFVGQTSNASYKIDYYILFNQLSSNTLDFRIVKKDSGGAIVNTLYSSSSSNSGVTVIQSSIYFTLNLNETLEFQFKSSSSAGYELFQNAGQGSTFNVTIGLTTVINSTLLNTQRGDLNQWDFVKALFTMFNLVTIPNSDNAQNLTIEPYLDVFIVNTSGTNLAARSIQHDWTDKVDATQIKLTPIELKKKTIFKYEEDDEDYPFTLYKNGTGGVLYGSKIFDALSLFGFSLLSEEEEIIASPFAATLVKPLYDRFPDFIVPAIYSSNDDQTEFKGFDNKPRILYDNGKVDSNTTYYIPAQNGLSSEQQAYFGQFTHLSSVNPTTTTTEDLNFESLQLINPVGIPYTPVDNLYNTYYAPYYNELYNPDTRIMTIKVNLNAADINTFEFTDKVMIQNREYRVNKIDYKPNDLSTVEFILIG
tara:strand:- start:2537 stop:5305 length:2769 start_codon:yes stop_codon:yes gene_type:complete